MLMSGLLLGFVALIMADQNSGRLVRDQSQAYAAAHSGIEKLTSDLGNMFVGGNYSPTTEQIAALTATAARPAIPGYTYADGGGSPGYGITPQATKTATIKEGAYEGLVGLITPYKINVTAQGPSHSEVSLQRELQTIAVPVFQFGIFSENDLSFFAGPNFNFGGRVHTNQNLYLKQDGGATLTLSERVSAVGEVVRSYLSNGKAGTHNGTVRMAKAADCLPPPAPDGQAACRNLGLTEESVNLAGTASAAIPPSLLTWNPGPPGRFEMVLRPGNTAKEPSWTNLSLGSGDTGYNGWLKNGRTGARRLELPIVNPAAGTTPIDIVRRPKPGDATGMGTAYEERFYRLASLRIQLSDVKEDITGLPGATAGDPLLLESLVPGTAPYTGTTPFATAATFVNVEGKQYRLPAGDKLARGYIKIDRQKMDGTFEDVTAEILSLGIAGRNLSTGTFDVAGTTCLGKERDPDAVIRLQRVRDDPSTYSATSTAPDKGTCGRQNVAATGYPWSTTGTDYIPLALFDAREGARRENESSTLVKWNDATKTVVSPTLGGIMFYVELDVLNFKRWLAGTIGTKGPGTMNDTGYVVYFSDRRGNHTSVGAGGLPVVGTETGEFGFENFVNRGTAKGADDGVFDTGEDVNGDGVRQVYGAERRTGGVAFDNSATSHYGTTAPNGTLTSLVWPAEARINPPLFFRRALKVVHAGLGDLPANEKRGLTIASENPVYVEGNFNACGTSIADCASAGFDGVNGAPAGLHVSAAVIADAVTFLSRSWNDINSFTSPYSTAGRQAATTWYRLGIISGKGLSFPTITGEPDDFGTDGGAHNFLRYIEKWSGQALNYRGSIVSLFINRQAVGTFKCCGLVYDPPTRGYNFEDEFLTPDLLPPRTPMFRDINTLSFRQVIRPPTQ
jgi:hypothetical protein